MMRNKAGELSQAFRPCLNYINGQTLKNSEWVEREHKEREF